MNLKTKSMTVNNVLSKHILNRLRCAKTISDPWEHQVTRSILPEAVFSVMKDSCILLESTGMIYKYLSLIASRNRRRHISYKDSQDVYKASAYNLMPVTLNCSDWYGISKYAARMIELLEVQLNNNINQLCTVANLPSKGSDRPTVQVRSAHMPIGCLEQIHVDNPEKLWTGIIHIDPSLSTGTLLFKDKSGEDGPTCCTWEPNSMTSFVNSESKWHSYMNRKEALSFRSTLIINIWAKAPKHSVITEAMDQVSGFGSSRMSEL